MHLRAIKLNGFKSFADQTELGFDRGVTAVLEDPAGALFVLLDTGGRDPEWGP